MDMSILHWEPRKARSSAGVLRVPGMYAGRARFKPRNGSLLPDVLTRSTGRVFEFGFAGIAANDHPFAGQALYLEWRTDDNFEGFLIPEQDLEFLHETSDPRG